MTTNYAERSLPLPPGNFALPFIGETISFLRDPDFGKKRHQQYGPIFKFDGDPFMQWVMDFCRWIVQVVLRPKQTKGFVLLKKRPCGRTHFCLADGMSALG